MEHTLRTLDGIIRLLHIEEEKPEEKVRDELMKYIDAQKQQHPQRHEINIARGYLMMKLQKDYSAYVVK